MIRKLPWPMSRIDRDLLHELWLAGQQTGKPITEIVAEAVTEHLNRRLDQTARAAEPTGGYSVEPQAPATAAA